MSEAKHCGTQVDHKPHTWSSHRSVGWPRETYECSGRPPVVEGGRFGLRPRGTLTVTQPEDRGREW